MGSGGEGQRSQGSRHSPEPDVRAQMDKCGEASAVRGAHCRPLGHTEEAWMNAFSGGTGHTALGVLMRRHLDRAAVQRAVDSVLRVNPRARTVLILPQERLQREEGHREGEPQTGSQRLSGVEAGKASSTEQDMLQQIIAKGRPAFLVPEMPSVKVRVARGWQPRDSMEQLSLLQQEQLQQVQQKAALAEAQSASGNPGSPRAAQANAQGQRTTPVGVPRVDTCFEIGRRWDPSETPRSVVESAAKEECSCGCGCDNGEPRDGAPESRGVQRGDTASGDSGTQVPEERALEGSAGPTADQGKEQGSAAEGGCVGKCSCGVRSGRYKLSMCRDKWLQVVEAAMNDPWEEEEDDDEDSSEGGTDEDPAAEHQGEGGTEEFLTPPSSPKHWDVGDTPEAAGTWKEVGEEKGSVQQSAGQEAAGSREEKKGEDGMEPFERVELFKVTLHRLPPAHSLLLMRVHTMACDRVSAAQLMDDVLKALKDELKLTLRASPPASGDGHQAMGRACAAGSLGPGQEQVERPSGLLRKEELGEGKEDCGRSLKSVEDCIPKKLSKKPIWAHGVDVIGYGLGSRRHAYLPFRNTVEPRKSQLIRSGLSRRDTDRLLQSCTRERTSIYGVLCAAILKAAAESKALGNKAEHFGVTTLLDLRPMLPEELHERTMGFYHSAMMNTHHVSEQTELWDLARRCHESMVHSVSKRKQFTDMGDLLMLMGQAMQHPNLTPSGSLRTSLLSIFRDTLFEKMEPYSSALDIEDYIGCSSIHGVGPCLAVFDSIREDGLHMANVYPAPLFSRSQMRCLVIQTMEILHKAIAEGQSPVNPSCVSHRVS